MVQLKRLFSETCPEMTAEQENEAETLFRAWLEDYAQLAQLKPLLTELELRRQIDVSIDEVAMTWTIELDIPMKLTCEPVCETEPSPFW